MPNHKYTKLLAHSIMYANGRAENHINDYVIVDACLLFIVFAIKKVY